MDHSGIFLGDVSAVFDALLGADTNPELQAIARDLSPLLSAHRDNIRLNEKLFARVKAVYDQRSKLSLTPEESYLLENTYKGFIRNGALLDAAGKDRLRQLNGELSLLGLKFGEQSAGRDQLVAHRHRFTRGLGRPARSRARHGRRNGKATQTGRQMGLHRPGARP